MQKPFLVGDNIYLRGLDEKDLEGRYIEWLNDPEVCENNSHHVFPYYYDNAKKYIEKTYNSRTELVLALVLKENDLHIGNISLQSINFINQSAEFAILLGEKQFWGKGYSKEAAKLIIKHGFMELNLNRIYCGTTAENIGMQKLALFLGMTQEGCRREAQYKGGRFIDMLEYGVLKKEFFTKFGLK
jgi:ribosomal-protein-alanine N-acetyltransferase